MESMQDLISVINQKKKKKGKHRQLHPFKTHEPVKEAFELCFFVFYLYVFLRITKSSPFWLLCPPPVYVMEEMHLNLTFKSENNRWQGLIRFFISHWWLLKMQLTF